MSIRNCRVNIAPSITYGLSAFASVAILGLVACTSTSDRAEQKLQQPTQEIVEQEQISVTGQRTRAQPMYLAKVAEFDALSGAHHLPISTAPNTEKYHHIPENTVQQVSLQPVSTFSIDVDTGSYSNARRMLSNGLLPPSDSVRIEEFINYFDYQYAVPDTAERPFSIDTAIAVSPWNKQRHLMRIGLKGFKTSQESKKPSNLVFLLDVSGSMNQPDKLGLLKKSLTLLSQQLGARDTVSMVVYAGASGVVLPPTKGSETSTILQALNKLTAGGSTNGAAGIEMAYQLARQSFTEGGNNRVILATDGDFNVGLVDHNQLLDLIKTNRNQGIALTTLGFGQGNYNDHLMEQIADAGNGNYAYIDTLNEARKVLVDEMDATMEMIAKDVKIQVEFNPALVAEYRLIGYENRRLNREDFNNDKVDAGDIGAGHSVTALYELTLQNSREKFVDPLRYGNEENLSKTSQISELTEVKLRYKYPHEEKSRLLSSIVSKEDIQPFENQSEDFQFASAVASFAQLLKHSKFIRHGFDDVIKLANSVKGADDFGYRAEFVQLVRTAKLLATKQSKINMDIEKPNSEFAVILDNNEVQTMATKAY